jgi:predicted DNA-binding protein (MmcQ/YjbR family)
VKGSARICSASLWRKNKSIKKEFWPQEFCSCGFFVLCWRAERGKFEDAWMDIDWVRTFCKRMPHATESLQWGDDLVFKVGGKMFAVLVLVPARVWLSFKCTPEEFAELIERPGIIPAPYSARYHWVALETREALATAELERLLRSSYEQVFAKLPRKTQSQLSGAKIKSTSKRRPRRRAR